MVREDVSAGAHLSIRKGPEVPPGPERTGMYSSVPSFSVDWWIAMTSLGGTGWEGQI